MKSSGKARHIGDWQTRFSNPYTALSLFVLLIAIYSLTYSGTFITDDEHILASRTLSLAFDGNLNDQRVYGNQRIHALSDTTPVYAARGVNIEPGQAVVGAFLARLAVMLGVGRVQSIFLLNIWVTALTAVLVYYACLFQGYPKLTALISALLFGLGTVAWPYSRTYFRDPLAAFFFALAWLCLLSLTRVDQTKNMRWLSFVGLIAGFAAGVLTKNTVVLSLPVLVTYILIQRYRNDLNNLSIVYRNNWKRILLWFGGVILLLILWFKCIPSDGQLARFAPEYYLFVVQKFFTTPHPNFLTALVGPVISPGKSIFIYSPILLLSFFALFKRWKIAWPAWSYLLLLIISQGLFYDSNWWGYINWGLRYLLPAIPLLVISSAQVVDDWLQSRNGRIGLISLGIVSTAVQIIGILPPMRQYYIDILATNPTALDFLALWHPEYSPWWWHIKWIASGGSWDLAAVRVGALSIPIILGFMIVIGIVLLAMLRYSRTWILAIGLFFCIGMTIFMLVDYKSDPAYSPTRTDLELAQETISQQISDDDLVLIKSYGTPAWFYWMNWADPNYQWTSLPFFFPEPSLIEEYNQTQDPEIVLNEITIHLFQELPGDYRRVWLLLPGDSPGVTLHAEENWLKVLLILSEEWDYILDELNSRLYLLEFTQS